MGSTGVIVEYCGVGSSDSVGDMDEAAVSD